MTAKGLIIGKINSLLFRFGVAVVKKQNRYEIPLFRHINIIKEVEGIFGQFIFPGFQLQEGSHLLISKLWGTGCSESMYIVATLKHSLSLEGDVCEFGVAQGATSALLANEIRETDKSLWLFDSFVGLPKPSPKDILIDDFKGLGSMERYEGTMAHSMQLVKDKLENISFPTHRVRIIPGFIEDTIKRGELPEKVCFAYLDFDFYEPTKQVLKYLDHHLEIGGHVVIDDFGYFSKGIELAVKEFLEREALSTYRQTLPPKWAGKFCILEKVK